MRRFEQRFLIGPALDRINQNLLNIADRVKPDVILIYAGLPIRPQTVKELSRRFWTAGYHNDDPFGQYGKKAFFRWFKTSLPYYSSHHVYRKKNLIEYRELGIKRVSILMPYYCQWLSYPVNTSGGAEHPVVFVGNGEPGPRTEGISYIIEQGIPVRLFGLAKYWRRYLPGKIYKRLVPIVPVMGEGYNAIITKSKISLAFFSSINNDQYTRRVFEIPACKGFLLAQRTPVMQELYVEGREAEYFSSNEELVDKIRYYLSHENQRQKIIEGGYRRCMTSEYDIYSRMRQWVRDQEQWMG